MGLDYVVLVTDKNLNVLGDPIVCWTSLDITLKFNEPDSGIMVAPAYSWITGQIAASNRIVVMRSGTVLIAGPIEGWLLERSDDGENAGVGKLTVHFADDFALLAARSVYPDPANTPDAQTLDNWTFTGNAEVGLRTLVNVQAGPGAQVARRVPSLALGALASVGTSVTVTALRMQPLGDVARAIAETGGKLGFRTRQSGAQILFEVYASPDKSGTVRFGFGLGNLRYIAYQVDAPKATAVQVGGQGTGADRFMTERINATDLANWGRTEQMVARPGNDALQSLQDDGDAALADAAQQNRLATTVADTPDQMYGRDYGLGDIVAVESWPGQQVVDVVRTVHLQVYSTAGETVSATVGSQAATTDPLWVKRLNEINERLGRVERIVTPI